MLPTQPRWVRGSHSLRLYRAGSLLSDHMIPPFVGEETRDVEQLFQGHTTGQQQSQDQNPGLQISIPLLYSPWKHINKGEDATGQVMDKTSNDLLQQRTLLVPCLDHLIQAMHYLSAAVSTGCSAACGIFPDQGSNPRPLHWQADSFFFLTSLLEYNCFTMVCQFLLYNKVNQLYIYICSHISSLLRLPLSHPPYPTPLAGHKALS